MGDMRLDTRGGRDWVTPYRSSNHSVGRTNIRTFFVSRGLALLSKLHLTVHLDLVMPWAQLFGMQVNMLLCVSLSPTLLDQLCYRAHSGTGPRELLKY